MPGALFLLSLLAADAISASRGALSSTGLLGATLGIPVSAGGWALFKSILVWVKASMLSLVGSEGLSPAT